MLSSFHLSATSSTEVLSYVKLIKTLGKLTKLLTSLPKVLTHTLEHYTIDLDPLIRVEKYNLVTRTCQQGSSMVKGLEMSQCILNML